MMSMSGGEYDQLELVLPLRAFSVQRSPWSEALGIVDCLEKSGLAVCMSSW